MIAMPRIVGDAGPATGCEHDGMTVISTLIVARPRQGLVARARTYRIEVDGAAKGTVASGRELALALPPGAHRVRVKTGRTEGPELKVHLGPGGTVRLTVAPGPDGVTLTEE
jgi:hypothetical protein